jgi:catechol 2,3-dioxygenase-like lactoylglutathione lyase family enzyme
MRIHLTSVLVDDQAKALRFYTEVLGFVPKTDVPVGEHRWLTVVSPNDPDGTELPLEPDAHPTRADHRARHPSPARPATPDRSVTRPGHETSKRPPQTTTGVS